jgi:hypothetical protein
MARSKDSGDRELVAIGTILRALDGLDGESIQRVLDYVFGRLSITTPRYVKPVAAVTAHPASTEPGHIRRSSIRDLKEEKQPESSNQMAALVAYYLSEIADPAEQKGSVNGADLEKYFKQAGFKLPKSLSQTLINAAAAGYLDSAGSGLYTLNAVGYNLIVHALPRSHSVSGNQGRRRPNRKTKRRTR